MMKPGERSVSEPTQAPFFDRAQQHLTPCAFIAIETRSRSTRSPGPTHPQVPGGSLSALKTPHPAQTLARLRHCTLCLASNLQLWI